MQTYDALPRAPHCQSALVKFTAHKRRHSILVPIAYTHRNCDPHKVVISRAGIRSYKHLRGAGLQGI